MVPERERGAALLTVLLLVAMIAVLAGTALERLRLTTRLAGNALGGEQARDYARAAEALAPEQPAVLRLHPEVAQALHALPGLADGARLQLRPDPTLAPTDCVFDTPAGQLIASLQHQLQRLGQQLQAAAAQEAA